MATAVEVEGRSGTVNNDRASAELVYKVYGTTNDATAQAAALSEAPATHRGLPLVGSTIDEILVGVFEVVVSYSSIDIPETGESEFSFEIGAGSQHITQSLETIAIYAPDGETAPDFKGAIGVTDDSVEGVDISVPVYRFSEKHIIAAASVTGAYKALLFEATATTNNASFKGFAAGEVLFQGASGTTRNQSEWEVTFNWAASKNETDLVVGDISGIAKKGWEYMWVRYREVKDDDAGRIVRRPSSVHIERVYKASNYALLGVGT